MKYYCLKNGQRLLWKMRKSGEELMTFRMGSRELFQSILFANGTTSSTLWWLVMFEIISDN
jgi:hypothetical protein